MRFSQQKPKAKLATTPIGFSTVCWRVRRLLTKFLLSDLGNGAPGGAPQNRRRARQRRTRSEAVR